MIFLADSLFLRLRVAIKQVEYSSLDELYLSYLVLTEYLFRHLKIEVCDIYKTEVAHIILDARIDIFLMRNYLVDGAEEWFHCIEQMIDVDHILVLIHRRIPLIDDLSLADDFLMVLLA